MDLTGPEKGDVVVLAVRRDGCIGYFEEEALVPEGWSMGEREFNIADQINLFGNKKEALDAMNRQWRGKLKPETFITPKRATEIWKNRGPWGSFLPVAGACTEEEDKEIDRLWLMPETPGTYSWVDTLLAINRGEHAFKRR